MGEITVGEISPQVEYVTTYKCFVIERGDFASWQISSRGKNFHLTVRVLQHFLRHVLITSIEPIFFFVSALNAAYLDFVKSQKA